MPSSTKRQQSYQTLVRRIQQQLARARNREQFEVTLFRLDEDDPIAWDRILDEFDELDYVTVTRGGPAEALIAWDPTEAEAAS
ncbi:DUF1654 domain-containing protein [Salinicola endophyticus]|uniref:DUF1654 domain-containing protein n=1 Tax=Salinicola endophyticus TaxID=1949083 RepID=A0AB74UH36_9GAMM